MNKTSNTMNLINGSWVQTISKQIEDLEGLLESLNECCESGNTENQCCESGNTENECVSAATTVNVTDIINIPPKEITVVEWSSPDKPKPIIKVEAKYVQPPPRIHKVNVNSIYPSQCGAGSSNNPDYVECTKCVDKWLAENNNIKPTKNLKCYPCKCNKTTSNAKQPHCKRKTTPNAKQPQKQINGGHHIIQDPNNNSIRLK